MRVLVVGSGVVAVVWVVVTREMSVWVCVFVCVRGGRVLVW